MKVVLDIRANHDTGVARYGLSTLAAVAPIAADHGIDLLAVTRPDRLAQAVRAAGGAVEVVAVGGDDGFVRRSPQLRDLLADRKADLYFTTHYTVDRHCPVPFSFTIHDLHRLRSPALSYTDATFTARFGPAELDLVRQELAGLADYDDGPGDDRDLFNRYFTALNRHQGIHARRIVSVSTPTSRDITHRLAVPPGKIDLVPCGVDTTVFRPRTSQEISAVRTRFHLEGPYLVFVGLAHTNKRFEWLAGHLARARDAFPPGARLVAVGGHAEQLPGIHQMLADLGAADFVVFTGRVSDDDLAALYSGSAAWVTASLSEGNNLPPLETLACGGEVIATDIPPLRAPFDTFAHFYQPDDDGELVKLATHALGGRLSRRGDGFPVPSWTSAGGLLVRSWRNALDGD